VKFNIAQKFLSLIVPILIIIVVQFILSGCNNIRDHAPVLILASDKGFGTYTGEILRTEGYNEYDIVSLSEEVVTTSFISKYDIVILAQQGIVQEKKEMIIDYVKKGGQLIAFRPDSMLSCIFGINPAGGIISEGYINIDTLSPEGRGLVSESLQFHGYADLYNITGGRLISSLFTDSRTKSEFPALVASSYGKGHTYAFTYNLPQSIVYTRQGNPLSAGIEKDGINGLRAMDLFTDGWLDPTKNTINQADMQMSLLSHCIEILAGYCKPLPRLWYFPDTLKSLVSLTNDGEYRGEKDFETQFSDIDSAGALMTLYVMETDKVSREWTDRWISREFEISGHPDDTREAGNPGWVSMDNILGFKMKELSDLYGIEMKTIVNHWFVWCGSDSAGNPEFAAQAAIEAKHGLGLDINYAHYDNGSVHGHFLGERGIDQGNFTGSGLIMKFASGKGEILDIFQHLNNVYDQQYNENNDPVGFFNCFKGLIDRSINDESYSYISIKSHNDEYYFSKDPLMKMLQYADSIGIPVLTAEKLLYFVKMRDEARFTDHSWTRNRVSFNLNFSDKQSGGLAVLLPYEFNDKKIESIKLDGLHDDFIIRTVKGTRYAFITVNKVGMNSISVKYN